MNFILFIFLKLVVLCTLDFYLYIYFPVFSMCFSFKNISCTHYSRRLSTGVLRKIRAQIFKNKFSTKPNGELFVFPLSDILWLKLNFLLSWSLLFQKNHVSACSWCVMSRMWKTCLKNIVWKTTSCEHQNLSDEFFF